uniref:Centrosomal protein of 120 kDa n=1 Tax=Phallusia mammillata TaxID=59560 RepID=A0A6F9D8V0_9ASCI|nr:centrosomal protein of 120 kDa [Phallusia mammillata]
MQKEGYLVVVSLLEGRNFPSRPKHNLLIECKFDGELLATDPVAHNEVPNFTTELAWEMDRKSLHQHRMQRTPVKLQCYAVDTVKNIREHIGYILLDLRGAQLKAQPAKWYNILSSKYPKLKPAVKISMILEDDSASEKHGFKAQEAPPRSVPPIAGGEIEAVLNDEGGYFQIGPESSSCEMFILAVTVGSAFNLEQLIPGQRPLPALTSGFFFYYSLFGSDITNDPFFDLLSPDITPERASIRISSTVNFLKGYFNKHSVLKVHLCCGDHLLGSASAPFVNLFTKKHVNMLKNDTVIIDGTYHLTPPDNPIDHEAIQPRVNVSLALRKESVEQHTPRKSQPKVVDENFEAAPNDKPVRDTDSDEKPTSAQPKLVHSTPTKVPLKSPERQKKMLDTEDDATSLSSEDEVQPKQVNAPSPIKPLPSKPSHADQSNSLATTETHTDIPPPTHHFRFSLDIKTISKLQLPHACNIFVKYSYPFFGSYAPIMTSPVQVTNQSEVIVPHSACAFDFACPVPLLMSTFRTVPIELELWHKDKESDNIQLGTTTLALSKIVEADQDTILLDPGAARSPIGYRQTFRASLHVVSPSGGQVAQLNVVTNLENLGEVRDRAVLKQQQPSRSDSSDQPKPKPRHVEPPVEDPRETNEYKAAIELELWKSQERDAFSKRLKDLETQHLQTLGEEFKKRDREREALVAKRIAEYHALEKKLSTSIASLEKREQQVTVAEQELTRLNKDAMREKDRVLTEAKEATRRMKDDCVHQVQLERERRALLEEQNGKLTKQINELEKKYAAVMAQFYDYKNEQSTRPEMRLQAELNLLRLEKTEVERKLESTTKSKLHYKQQWGRTLKELAMMKKREQDHAMANLKQQQQELENLKIRYLASDEKKALENDSDRLKQIESDIRSMKQGTAATKMSSIAIEPCQEKSSVFEDINERVSRLIEERDTLLRTGVYSDSDRIITELDRQIKEEMAKRGRMNT